MTSPNRRSQTEPNDKAAVGMIASGNSGIWEITIDEVLSDPKKRFIQLDNGVMYLYCELKSIDVVKDISTHIKYYCDGNNATSKRDALAIGSFGKHSVTMIFDDERSDRMFFVVFEKNNPCAIRFEVSNESISHFKEAVEQVESDLFQ